MDIKEKLHLIQLTKSNMDSFVYFHRKYQSKVYQYSLKFVGSKEVAEEITSDVFYKIWEKRRKLKTDRTIDGLVFKITKDFSISYLRKIAKNKTLRATYIQSYLTRNINNAEEKALFEEKLLLAEKAIDELPPKCKEVFRLRYFEGMSLKQIATTLGISANTAKNHLQKGKQIIKTYLQEYSDVALFIIVFFQFI